MARDLIVTHSESLAMATQALPVLLSALQPKRLWACHHQREAPPSSQKIFLWDPSHHHSQHGKDDATPAPNQVRPGAKIQKAASSPLYLAKLCFCNNELAGVAEPSNSVLSCLVHTYGAQHTVRLFFALKFEGKKGMVEASDGRRSFRRLHCLI